jgi:hypothetical protein
MHAQGKVSKHAEPPLRGAQGGDAVVGHTRKPCGHRVAHSVDIDSSRRMCYRWPMMVPWIPWLCVRQQFVQGCRHCVRPKRAYAFGIARSCACVLRVGVRLWMATDAPLLRLSLHRRALAVLH